jgi:histidinol-phosphate transaminase
LYKQLKENGVLVRYFAKDRIDNYLRITIGTDEEMGIFIEKLEEII